MRRALNDGVIWRYIFDNPCKNSCLFGSFVMHRLSSGGCELQSILIFDKPPEFHRCQLSTV